MINYIFNKLRCHIEESAAMRYLLRVSPLLRRFQLAVDMYLSGQDYNLIYV